MVLLEKGKVDDIVKNFGIKWYFSGLGKTKAKASKYIIGDGWLWKPIECKGDEKLK